MSIICGLFLFLALVVPGHIHPNVSIANICAVIFIVLFVLEKSGMSRWGT